MRWMAIKRKDDSIDKYAIAFVTHTVCKTLSGGRVSFEAWRLAADFTESVPLGIFSGANAFELAKLCVENDMREQKAKVAA